MTVEPKVLERNVRTVLVSDIHLGCRYAQAEHFLSFLRRVRPQRLFILGDFLDGWKLSSRWRWRPVYSAIVDRLLDLADGGTELLYTPGNHDAFLRMPEVARLLRNHGTTITVDDEFVYETARGHRFLVLHGDRFDVVETRHQWLSKLLTHAYEPLLSLNWLLNRLTRQSCSPYATCAILKNRLKTAVRFFSHFEETLFRYALERDCDGVICGHVHTPGITVAPHGTYINTGDWVENCTALIETLDGQIVLESFYSDRAAEHLAVPGESREYKPREASPVPVLSPSAARVA